MFQLCGRENGSFEFIVTRTGQITLPKGSRIDTVGTPGDELAHYYVLQSLPSFYQTFFLLNQRGYNLFPQVTWRYLELKNNSKKILFDYSLLFDFRKQDGYKKLTMILIIYTYIYMPAYT